jgi:hypothetical protein
MKSASKRCARQTMRHRAKPKSRLRPGCSDWLTKNPASAGFFMETCHRISKHWRSNVGVSLLAIAVCQSHQFWLSHRYREQARSHSRFLVWLNFVFSLLLPTLKD